MTYLKWPLVLSIFCTTHCYPQAAGRWVGEIDREGKSWRTELDFRQQKGKWEGYFNIPDYGLYHLEFDSIGTRDRQLAAVFHDKAGPVRFTGIISSTTFAGDWSGLGMNAKFSTRKADEHPREFLSQEISFSNHDATLSGTLIMPDGPGPFPAVVQVHGSGNQTRSEQFYSSRAFLLAQTGIAVLIYDRRGKGKSTGATVSMELLADDAIAGVHFLLGHPAIRKEKIGIMGFSQGGYIAPLAACRSQDIKFVIAGSAPGISPDEQNDFDVQNKLKNRSVTRDTIDLVINFRKALRKFRYTGEGSKSDLQSEMQYLRSRRWFRHTLLGEERTEPAGPGVKEFLTFDPLPVWGRVHVPVLLMWGQLDEVVPAEQSQKLIGYALAKGGNRSFTGKVFPRAGHGGGLIDNSGVWDWPRLAPGYHELLVDWASEVCGKVK